MKKILLGDDYSSLFKSVSEFGTPTGIVLAKATGRFLQDDITYMEVIVLGKSFFVKPCFSFGSINFPSKKWLDKYKDKIGVWVGFENNNSAHGIYLGICPLDDTDFEIPYEDAGGWFSTEFCQFFDDVNKVLKIFKKDSNGLFKLGVIIKEDSIIIGEEKSVEGVILGDSFIMDVKDILTSLLNDTLVVSGTTAKHNPATIVELTNKISKLEQHISKTVKIS